MIGGGHLLYLKFWVKVTALERNRRVTAKSPISDLFSLVAPQPLAKKVQLTLIGNPLRAFQ